MFHYLRSTFCHYVQYSFHFVRLAFVYTKCSTCLISRAGSISKGRPQWICYTKTPLGTNHGFSHANLGSKFCKTILRLAAQSSDCTQGSVQSMDKKANPPKLNQGKESRVISIENHADLD